MFSCGPFFSSFFLYFLYVAYLKINLLQRQNEQLTSIHYNNNNNNNNSNNHKNNNNNQNFKRKPF